MSDVDDIEVEEEIPSGKITLDQYVSFVLDHHLKDNTIEDSLLFFWGYKCIQLADELFKEVNLRDLKNEQQGYTYNLLKAFKEKYPDFEDEYNKQ